MNTSFGPTNKYYWGPRLWRVLHTLSCAPSVGRPADRVQDVDERALWSQVFKYTASIMPCTVCTGHYKDWLMTHKILRNVSETKDLKEFIKGELFDLHCDINATNGVRPPNPIPYTAMEERYPPYGLRSVLAELDTMFEAAKELRTINIDAVKMWKKAVDQLIIKYNILAIAPPAPAPVPAPTQPTPQPIVQIQEPKKTVDVEGEKARMLAELKPYVESEKARMLADLNAYVETEKVRMIADLHAYVESEKTRMLAELEAEKVNMRSTSEIETCSASMSGLSIIDDVEEEWLGH